MHRGIDIAASVGTPVVAARGGTVTYAGTVGSSGLTVSVRTDDGGYTTSYLHLSALATGKGETVRAGTRIGEVGTSGRRSVDEPHLHFGVRLADREDQYVDPLSLLPAPAAPAATPPVLVPAPVPLRAEQQPVPMGVPVAAGPRPRPISAPARVRPRGTLDPGPAWAPSPLPAGSRSAPPVRRGSAAPGRVPAGPEPAGAGVSAAPAARSPVPHRAGAPAPASSSGRKLVLAGLGLVGLVLFGGVAWRWLASANASVNGRAAAAAVSIRDRARIGPTLRRILSP
jgi:hypothetical protein